MLNADEFDQACDVLIEHEGLVPWLYCDSCGFVTVGVGDKVSGDGVATMPFVCMDDGSAVDGEAKRVAFVRVQDFFCKGLTASAYGAISDLRLPVDYCRRRLVLRLKSEFLPGIVEQCPQAESFPTAAKLALVDICYNVGVRGFASFIWLIAYCNGLQFEKAASCVHTKREGENAADFATWGKRNNWRRTMMLAAARTKR